MDDLALKGSTIGKDELERCGNAYCRIDPQERAAAIHVNDGAGPVTPEKGDDRPGESSVPR